MVESVYVILTRTSFDFNETAIAFRPQKYIIFFCTNVCTVYKLQNFNRKGCKTIMFHKWRGYFFITTLYKYTKWQKDSEWRLFVSECAKLWLNFEHELLISFKLYPCFVIMPLWGRQRGSLRLSNGPNEDAIWALSYCQMGLMRRWINIRLEVSVYA